MPAAAAAPACVGDAVRVEAVRAPSTAAPPPANGWQPVTLPDVWTQRWPGYDGTVWYRLTWERRCAAPVAFALDYLNMAGAAYVNGHPLWSDTALDEPLSRSWNLPRYGLLPETALQPGTNTLTVAVVGRAIYSPGLGRLQVGAPAALYPHYERAHVLRYILPFVSATTSLMLALLFFVLWLMRRREHAFGWFALIMLAWWVYATNLLVTRPWPFATTDSWERLMSVAVVVFASGFLMFVWHFLNQRRPRLGAALGLVTLLEVLVLAGIGSAHLGTARAVLALLPAGIFFAACAYFIVVAIRQHLRGEVGVLAACMVLSIGTSLHDLLVFIGVLDSNLYVSPLGVQLLVIVMALVLVGRFARTLRRVEGFKDELETTVVRTRAELQAVLQREHALAVANAHMSGRLALARDLHDGLGGQLVGAIARIEHGEASVTPAQWLALLKDMREDLRQVIDANHTVPVPATPEEWLAPVRSRYGRMFEAQDVAATWQVPAAWPWQPSPRQALALTRVVQEACTNVLKHSRARQASIALDIDDAQLRLCVEDDGIGFEVAKAAHAGGVGLTSMAERMQRLGASLNVYSVPGRTCLSMVLDRDAVPGPP